MSFSKIPQNANFDTNREFSTEEISRLNSILECNLGPEFISKRPNGFGGPVSYIEGFKALNLANYVFGFNGWNSEIKSTTVDYVDDHGGNGRFSIGLSVIIRISLKDGTYHEDIGYGSVENAKGRPAAFEKAKKQAITDGMKRCLRCFGNVLGNCLYDKDYLKYIGKVKTPVPKFSEAKLLRHPDIKRLNKIKQLEDAQQNTWSAANTSDCVPNTNTGSTSRNVNTANQDTSATNILKETNFKVNNNSVQAKYQRQSINVKHGKILSNITNSVSATNGSTIGKNSPQAIIDDSDKPMSVIDAKKNTILTASLFDDSFDDNFGDEDDEFNDIDEYELELITNKITSSANIQQPTTGQQKNPKDILNDLPPVHPDYNSNSTTSTAPKTEGNNMLAESAKSIVDNTSNSNEPASRPENSKEDQIPSSVAFVSAKSAAVILKSGDSPSTNMTSINKPFKTNIKSRSVDHTKSTPIKRSMVDRNPVYPSSKLSATNNPNKRVNI